VSHQDTWPAYQLEMLKLAHPTFEAKLLELLEQHPMSRNALVADLLSRRFYESVSADTVASWRELVAS
jgi:hypothetical protein